MTIAIVTPSYISSPKVAQVAQYALQQLQDAIGSTYPHIVVDDIPRMKGRVIHRFPDLGALNYAPQVYRAPHIQLIRRYGRGSTSAILRAVREARKQGHDLVFIHLDDNCYLPLLGELLHHAQDAFAQFPALQFVRTTGIPILSGQCSPELGNLTHLQIEADSIGYAGLMLTPHRQANYTLWSTIFDAQSMDGDYWAIPMWSTIYRVDFLEKLLTLNNIIRQHRSLGGVELYYRNNWKHLYPQINGEFGYINMQFAGLEMQRNKNWRELLTYPNEPKR